MNNSQETKIVATDNVALAKKFGFNKWDPERAQFLRDKSYAGNDVKTAEDAGIETGYVPEVEEDKGGELPSVGNSTERSSTSTESKSSESGQNPPSPAQTTGSHSKPDPKVSSTAPQTGGSGTASPSAGKGSDK